MNSVGDGELANKSIHIKLFQANKHESRSNEDRNQPECSRLKPPTSKARYVPSDAYYININIQSEYSKQHYATYDSANQTHTLLYSGH